ncbi:chromosomal protein D1-like [Phlebotomus argentipes]|uniref:chromosomal protein D1-like n=1 Tax=Phlebotomus argentipes TaxID=94469 RepID=UPI00289324CC|nr:chromosomal protein D1-like [Phlebotomus argentipes]
MSDTEAPVEVKKRGRPAKNTQEKEAKKRGHAASPKKDKSPAAVEVADTENGEAPAKRGRGRPPKAAKKAVGAKKAAPPAAKPKGTGRGRGRPPKAKPPASSEDNDDDDDDDEDEKEEA